MSSTFAINREYFFKVGGYDEGLVMEGGENIELSFKLWFCGDGIYEIPCSKVAQIFDLKLSPKNDNIDKNHKRIVEIWLDDYKSNFYSRDPAKYENLDVGDISYHLKMREHCVPFNYFLEFVADEMPRRYPIWSNYSVFASGQIKPSLNQKVCLENMFGEMKLSSCENFTRIDNSTEFKKNQNFIYSFHKNIFLKHADLCLDANKMAVIECSYNNNSDQYWSYSMNDKQLISGMNNGQDCLGYNSLENTILMTSCNETDELQKWEFTFMNETSLNQFDSIYGYDLELIN